MFPRLCLGLALALAAATAASGAEWSTTYGRMTLPDDPRPGSIRVEYSSDEGRIIGELLQPKCLGCGLVLDGIWVERGAAERCDSSQDGSPYWGAVELEFNPEFTSFSGEWDYCRGGGTHSWQGKVGTTRMTLLFR